MIEIDLDGLARFGYSGPLVRWLVDTDPCGCKWVTNYGPHARVETCAQHQGDSE